MCIKLHKAYIVQLSTKLFPVHHLSLKPTTTVERSKSAGTLCSNLPLLSIFSVLLSHSLHLHFPFISVLTKLYFVPCEALSPPLTFDISLESITDHLHCVSAWWEKKVATHTKKKTKKKPTSAGEMFFKICLVKI